MIALMMEAARTSETSVDIQLRTRQYIPDDSELRKLRFLHTPLLYATLISLFEIISLRLTGPYYRTYAVKKSHVGGYREVNSRLPSQDISHLY
jgi:hypothetical protein